MVEWSLLAIVYMGAALFSLWNYRHLPLVDFRPYDVGTLIVSQMEIPEGAPVDEYETTLVYRERASGINSDFSINDYPRDTAQWDFVSSESRLVSEGFEPPIHDFAIMDEYGNDLVDQILSDPGYSLLMICYDLNKADEDALLLARDWKGLELLADDFSFYAISASPTDAVNEIVSSLDLAYNFVTADEIMLKTIVRSNPGFMLISDGTIIGKWAYRDFPSVGEVNPDALELMGNAAAPMDEEAQLLMEAGVYERFSFNVLEFSAFEPKLIHQAGASARERGVIIIFILVVVMLILLSNLSVRIKT